MATAQNLCDDNEHVVQEETSTLGSVSCQCGRYHWSKTWAADGVERLSA
jgi:hypothetical protein